MGENIFSMIKEKDNNEQNKNKKSLKNWLKKIGVAGFLFFLIKGLVWVYVFVQAGKCVLE